MALTLYPVPGKEKSKLICNAFAAGAPRHATGAVFFGTEGVMQAFRRILTTRILTLIAASTSAPPRTRYR